ncbi:MAG: hypothetical protein M0P12_04810 [Paludibacteraceae bacterium]|nr:hypothetical protein [Paludibacteraceae bacterium]
MNNKSHAKDYLIEFSKDKPEWYKALINDAVLTNGDVTETRKDEIFNNLSEGTVLQSELETPTSVQNPSEKLVFKTLNHISGVNALSENQKIKFSDDVTILYGLNGSGKSSYFGILNNVSGGTQQKSIIPNIYANEADKKTINVSLEYKLENTSKSHVCKNSITVQPDFQGVKVFDSSYLNGLLQTKETDEAIVYPLGLHLFGYIAKIMDSFSSKLDQLATQELQKLPAIKIDNFSESIKNKFNNRDKFNNTERKYIKAKFNFSDEERTDLTQKENDLTCLQQTNSQDRITILTKENKTLLNFTTKINNAIKNLKDYSGKLKKAFEAYSVAKTKNDEARKQSEIITDLPHSDSPEWKSFIKAGQEYSSKLKKEEPEKCPYCHQEIKSEEAISIIKAYADFLNDNSEAELNLASENITNLQKEINEIDVDIVVSDEIKTAISDTTELQNKINQLLTYKLDLNLADKSDEIVEFTLDFTNELKVLENRQEEIATLLKNIQSSKAEKDKKISELQESIAGLKEKKSIAEQKSEIERYFSTYDTEQSILSKKNELNTRNLTILANQAHNELLTDTLRQKFEIELNSLGKDNLKVILEVKKGSKGKCQTQLKLVDNNSISEILSEGEQKAVGLAMFFAEVQDGNYPIILDDPVTSLDHEIASLLSKRLLNFDNQIIIFCHNRLFLDGFETSKKNHVCKNFDSCGCTPDKGKHIFIYQIYADGKEKGILSNYKGDNSDSLIKEAYSRLNARPFSDNYGVSILLRRAVEKIIDEEVFKHLLPPKVSNKNNRINWEDLKKINSKPELIDRLRKVHDDTSEEDHDGTASIENPISVNKLRDLLEELGKLKKEFNEIAPTV